MRNILLVCMLFPCMSSMTRAEDPVYFADPQLKAVVEEALWLADPTPMDMLDLTELDGAREFGAGGERISDLEGLEYATNLRWLNLRLHRIRDISPLSRLTNLESLNLSQNEVGDLGPLAGLSKLRHLNLHENPISSLWILSYLTRLETLILHGNGIEDIGPLSSLTHLRELDIATNHIRDLSPLRALTSLSYLDVRGNPLTQESYSTVIARIAANNPQASIRYDAHPGLLLTVSSTSGGAVIDPGEGEFIYEYAVPVRLEAREDLGFAFAGWFGTYSTDQNPVYITMEENARMMARFVCLRATLHVDDDAPGDPGPTDPTVSDPNEDGTPEHPFDRIQKALDVAGGGVTVLVHPGTYRENLDCLHKDIQLIGAGPNDPPGTAWPTIVAPGSGPAIHFSGREGLPRLLTGFVLSGGSHHAAGAIVCDQTIVNMTNCLIVGNYSSDPNGTAVYCTDSRISIANCTIADNRGGTRSAAIAVVDSDLTVTNSILWNDTSDQILALGASRPAVRYSVVRGWWSDIGNSPSDPLFGRRGRWVNPENTQEVLHPEDTRAVWSIGDYHLRSRAGRWDADVQTWVADDVTSPGIDGGDPRSPVGSEPEPNGGTINMGNYGGTSEASKS